jgi:hypothetical protein
LASRSAHGLRIVLLGVLSLGAAPALPGNQAARSLAPGQPDWVEHRRALEAKLSEVEALQTAVARIHNTLAAFLAAPQGRPCDSEQGRSLVARSRLFGAAYRDAAQSARAEAGRARALLTAPTVAPLLQEGDRSDTEALLQRSQRSVRSYLEAIAWQNRFVEPLLARCQAKLGPAEGLPGAGPVAGTDAAPVAVVGVGGGRICPGNFPADGRVVILRSAKACYGGSTCACEARPVLPGAVLGPPAATAPP